MINYDNKVFITVKNSENGDTNEETFFHYHQKGKIVTAEYYGGTIKSGFLTGIVDEDGILEMKYHHINVNNELLTGVSHTIPQIMIDGRLKLVENWQWTSKNFNRGQSILEEVNENQKANYLSMANGF